MTIPAAPAAAIAFAGGLTIWTTASLLGGTREPWDSDFYWSLAYPAALLFCGGLGFLAPERPLVLALIVMFGQAAIMLLGGSGLGLLPPGLALILVLSLPAMALAWIAARWRR